MSEAQKPRRSGLFTAEQAYTSITGSRHHRTRSKAVTLVGKLVGVALFCLLVVSSASRSVAAEVTAGIVARDLRVSGTQAAPGRFDLVGFHWRGSGSVS